MRTLRQIGDGLILLFGTTLLALVTLAAAALFHMILG